VALGVPTGHTRAGDEIHLEYGNGIKVTAIGTNVTIQTRTRRAFIGQLRQIAERQLAELAAAEGASRGLPAPPTPAPKASEDADGESRVHMKTPAWLESLVKE